MDLLEPLISLGPAVVYAALFALVFAESAAFLGLLVPGELALATAGALSVGGEVSLAWVLAVAFGAAVLGQAVAFAAGRWLGPRMLAAAEARPRIARDLPVARQLLLARGTRIVVASRWVGALCALVPMLAGASDFPTRRFMVAQTAAAAIWVAAVVGVGRAAAQGAANPHGWLLWIPLGVGAVVTVGIYLAWRRAIGRPIPRVAVGAAVAGALSIATALVLLRAAGPGALEQVLRRVDVWALVGAIGLQLVSTATLTQVYRATYAANGGRLRYRDALTLTLGAFSLMQLLPAGGAAGGLFAMRRLRAHGADAVRATTTVLLFGLITMGTLGLAISVATTVTALGSRTYTRYAVASAIVTALVVVGLVVLRHLTSEGPARRGLVARLGALTWRGRPVGRGWADSLALHEGLLQRPAALLRPMGWSAVNWTLDVAVLVLLLHAVGAGAPFLGVLVAFAVGHLLNGLPTTPGGIGVVEAGLAGTLIGFGADPAATSVAIIGYRAIALWLPVVIAAPVVVLGCARLPGLPRPIRCWWRRRREGCTGERAPGARRGSRARPRLRADRPAGLGGRGPRRAGGRRAAPGVQSADARPRRRARRRLGLGYRALPAKVMFMWSPTRRVPRVDDDAWEGRHWACRRLAPPPAPGPGAPVPCRRIRHE